MHSTFYQNDRAGGFYIPDAGFDSDTMRSFCHAIGDFNADGRPDIAVVNHSPDDNQLWSNSGSNNNWIKVELEGVISNRDAVGARIEIHTANGYQQRQVHCGIGFLGQNSETEIIGLETLDMVDSLIVTWPTGHIDRLFQIEANQKLFIEEGSTTGGEISIDPDITIYHPHA